jgi:hypothetical protein
VTDFGDDKDFVFGEEEIDDTGLIGESEDRLPIQPVPQNLEAAIEIQTVVLNDESIVNKSIEELKKVKNPFAADDEEEERVSNVVSKENVDIRTRELGDIFGN